MVITTTLSATVTVANQFAISESAAKDTVGHQGQALRQTKNGFFSQHPSTSKQNLHCFQKQRSIRITRRATIGKAGRDLVAYQEK
jgi:hypothetical protein